MTELSESQQLLLRAVLGRDANAVRAWREWEGVTEVEQLDPDSQWLLPALAQNLKRLGVPGQRLIRYHNVYRHNWYKNHLALHRAWAVIGGLQRRGQVVILGGAAMAMAYYDTIGERPFKGLDVLASGGEPGQAGPLRVRQSLYGSEADEALVRRSTAVEWRSLRACSLEPVDQLVDICARREGGWDSLSALVWQADVAAVLRCHPAIEWSQVEERAEAVAIGGGIAEARRALESTVLAGAGG